MERRQVDFDQLVNQVRASQVGKEQLAIWGGKCSETQVLDLVQQWPTLDRMPCHIWEYCSDITFDRDAWPEDVQLLERGRLFGEGGDLSLRRDGDHFRWWFIGPAGVIPPGGGKDFWQANPGVTFHEYEGTALLWGKGKQAQIGDETVWWWFDDRVARAKLCYPVEGQPGRVQIEYRIYSRAGRVEFVWLMGLSEYKEADNG